MRLGERLKFDVTNPIHHQNDLHARRFRLLDPHLSRESVTHERLFRGIAQHGARKADDHLVRIGGTLAAVLDGPRQIEDEACLPGRAVVADIVDGDRLDVPLFGASRL